MDAAKPVRRRVGEHRARLRAQGLRPVTLWLPDTRTPEFARWAHEASLAAANSPTEAEDQAFIDTITDWGDA